MTVTLTGPAVKAVPIEMFSYHEPFVHNGEAEIARLLRRYSYFWRYEPRFYPLVYPLTSGRICFGGFTPDFYLPPSSTRPGINIEVTFADHGLPDMSRVQYLANQDRLGIKKLKIQMTREIYRIETILITRAVFMKLRQNEDLVHHLIKNATHRHIRNAA